MSTPKIRTAKVTDADRTIAVVALAFSADPPARWAYSDPQQYFTHYPGFVKAFAGKAFKHKSAYYVDGYLGAALWLPPGVRPDDNAVRKLVQRTVPKKVQENVFAVFDQMKDYQPTEPHWYLPLIGVDPLHQNQGYGSALLEHSLLACDDDHKLAYLESSNPRNLPLYEKFGFEVLGTIQVGTSPPIFPMLRRPQ